MSNLYGYYLVLIKEPDNNLTLKIFHDKNEITLGSKYLPPDLNNLVKNFITQQSLVKNIYVYLTKNFYTYPIYLILNENYIKLWVNKAKTYTAELELNLNSKAVTITRIIKDQEKNKITGYLLLAENLIFNPTDGELVAITGSKIWNYFDNYYKGTNNLDQVIELSLSDFQKKPLSIKLTDIETINFTKNHKISSPVKINPKYNVEFFLGEKNVALDLFIKTHNIELLPSEKIFKYFGTLKTSEFPNSSKPNFKLFKDAFTDCLLKIFNSKDIKKSESAIKAFSIFSHNSLEMIKFFNTYLEKFQEKEVILLIKNSNWAKMEINHKKTALLYTSIFKLLGHNQVLTTDVYYELQVEKEFFFSRLADLQKKLAKKNIELFYHHKKLREGNLNLNLAIKQEKIDWFTLETEVLNHNDQIKSDSWIKILKNNGLLEEKDSISYFSKETLDKLQAISNYFQETGLKEKKEINFIPKLNIFHWLSLKEKGINLKLDKKTNQIIKSISQFKKITNYNLPAKFHTILRDYQKTAYSWLAFLYEHKFGACLADDMGLGKTIETIAFFAGITEGMIKSNTKDLPSLIIVPPTLIFNWRNEFQKFYPELKVFEYTGAKRIIDFSGSQIVITTYDIVRRDIEKIKLLNFNVIVFDEAQFIKNLFANRSIAVRKLNAEFKLCLTGTPLENNLLEYYSIMDLALPGLFNNLKSFQNLIKENNLPAIIERSKPFILRRTKQHILKDLPPKIETIKLFQLSELQQKLYFNYVEEVKNTIDEAFKNNVSAKAQIIALTALLRLRQLCISPNLINEKYPDYSPKIEFLINKLAEIKATKNKAIIFSQFIKTIDILEKYFKQTELPFLRLDGKTPLDQRKRIVKNFQLTNEPIFLVMSLKAGGIGLNLTGASYVFHMDPWWNPAVENQASDRAHRFGQNKTVFVNKLIMHGTIEEKMLELKQRKINLYDAILAKGTHKKTSNLLTKSDFDFLLS